MRCFSVAVFGLALTIASDDERILQTLERYVLPWLPRQHVPSPAEGLVFTVTGDGGPGRFRVCLDDAVITSGERMPGLFTALQWALDNAIVRQLSAHVVVHTGVVAWRNAAILLPGRSGSGKTTLVRELLDHGAEYCSDEYAIIDAQGLVHPWPRPLMMRDSGGEQHPLIASEIGAAVRVQPAPAGLILFLQHEPGADFGIRPMSQSEALLRLLGNTPHVLAEKPEIAGPLKSACFTAACFEGSRGDAAEAADRILELAATAW